MKTYTRRDFAIYAASFAVAYVLLSTALPYITKATFSKSKKVQIEFGAIKQSDLENILPVAVIGDGPAGASAALYAARSDLYTVVFQGPKPGGLLTETSYVENWPGVGKELGQRIMNNLRDQAREHGALFIPETVKAVNFDQWPYALELEDGTVVRACSVIISTGAVPKVLGVPGEQEYWGKGVTTCAICDAPFYKGKDVVVSGGGDSAVEEALQLAPHVRQVTMLVRRDVMRASKAMQERLKDVPNIKVAYNTAITEIHGDGGKVTHLTLVDTATKQTRTQAIDGVFLAIGHEPRTKLFEKQLATDENGYLVVEGRSQKTSQEGVYAAGDVEDHVYRQAGVAAGSGIKAALDAYAFMQHHGYTKETAVALQDKFFVPMPTQKIEIVQPATLAEFENLVRSAKEPVVVADFYARYCPSCMHMLPVVEVVARRLEGKVKFIKVDFAVAPDIAEKLEVAKVPALVVFKKGEVVARYHNVMNRAELTKFVSQFVD